MGRILLLLAAAMSAGPVVGAADDAVSMLYHRKFVDEPYGQIPSGWFDRFASRPSRAWIVDDRGYLRPTLKRTVGLLTYDGYLTTDQPARRLVDVMLNAEFRMATDVDESFGIAARVQDAGNYYLARFVRDAQLQLVVVADGSETVLSQTVPRIGYRAGERARLEFNLAGNMLTAVLRTVADDVVARVDAIDDRFTKGPPGLCATPYAKAESFAILADDVAVPGYLPQRLTKRNEHLAADAPRYAVVRPAWNVEELNTPPQEIAADYDVVVAGAGCGGFGAAVQAARLGARVLLIDETDWIGGQAAAAAVTSMDEDGVYGKYPVRERGLYREFHESMVAYYRSLDKDPFVAYYGNPQREGGYEPKAVRAVLYGLIAETRGRTLPDGAKPVLDVSLRTRVERVRKDGDRVVGVTLAHDGVDGAPRSRDVACRVLVDATEYGDVIPLTGARYRVSNGFGGAVDAASPIQDHTWVAVVKEYPGGVPDALQIKEAPPGYDEYAAKRFKKFQLHGLQTWGAASKGIKGPRDYRVYFAWRGMADAESPLVGRMSELRHTQCGFNGGNDYPVTAATCDDPEQRRLDERFGIERTLGTLYYFQHELGLNWSLADDEGFDTPYNRAKMKSLGLRPDLERMAVHLPQLPYVRESRRVVGVEALRAGDLTRYADAKHVATSVAMGDYFMDLDHGHTKHIIEADLDGELLNGGEAPRGGGPFQVPFAVFIPETIDGFLPAEKNFSQSRIANGATRLQPITMLTGQAVGTMAALAVRQNVQPRALSPVAVQSALLDSGSTLIQRWYADVPWGTPIWKATQLLSLYEVLDRPGPIDQDAAIPLGSRARWGVDEPLKLWEARAAVMRLATAAGFSIAAFLGPDGDGPLSAAELRTMLDTVDRGWSETVAAHEPTNPSSVTAGEFALIASDLLVRSAERRQSRGIR